MVWTLTRFGARTGARPAPTLFYAIAQKYYYPGNNVAYFVVFIIGTHFDIWKDRLHVDVLRGWAENALCGQKRWCRGVINHARTE